MTIKDIAKLSNVFGVEVVTIDNVVENVNSFEIMLAVRNVIFWEKLDSSKFSEMDRMVDICKQYDINMLGVVCG